MKGTILRKYDMNNTTPNFDSAVCDELRSEKSEKLKNKISPKLKSLLPSTRYFHTELKMQVVCTVCNYISTDRIEYYKDFSLDLETHHTSKNEHHEKENMLASGSSINGDGKKCDPIHLDDMFKTFFDSQERDFCCEKCQIEGRNFFGQELINNKSNSRARVDNRISTLPHVLALHIKRFRYDLSKITSAVQFPAQLLLPSALCTNDVQSPDFSTCGPVEMGGSEEQLPSTFDQIWQNVTTGTKIKKSSFEEKNAAAASDDKNFVYSLSAVVRHMGINAKSGHYICDVIDKSCENKGGKFWRRCDDSSITDISLDSVLKEQENPYMLFYTRSKG
jgi:uncharacterized UBP type Zn finger protein